MDESMPILLFVMPVSLSSSFAINDEMELLSSVNHSVALLDWIVLAECAWLCCCISTVNPFQWLIWVFDLM